MCHWNVYQRKYSKSKNFSFSIRTPKTWIEYPGLLLLRQCFFWFQRKLIMKLINGLKAITHKLHKENASIYFLNWKYCYLSRSVLLPSWSSSHNKEEKKHKQKSTTLTNWQAKIYWNELKKIRVEMNQLSRSFDMPPLRQCLTDSQMSC